MALAATRPNRISAEDAAELWLNIGRRIKMARLRRCMSREDLANDSGLDIKSQIDKYENGQNSIPISSIIAISKALRCSSDYLLGLKNETLEIIHILDDERRTLGASYVGSI